MKFLDRFRDVRVLVLGDVMLDRYWWGEVSRISPEAPVPVVRLKKITLAAGGAANVAANIAGLGARPLLIGCVGEDTEADLFPELFDSAGLSAEYLVRVAGRPTTVKTRVVAHSQQVTRIDQETVDPLGEKDEQDVLNRALTLLNTVHAIAISDYAKGLLSDRLLAEVIKAAAVAGIPVIVDPKGKDYAKYRGSTLLTPNRREAAEACNIEDNGKAVVDHAGASLIDQVDVEAVLVTEGEEGMTLFRRGQERLHLPALARHVYDVTGAGDTVIGTLSTAIAAGAKLDSAARLANAAAGLVVEQVGTTAIDLEELRKAIGTGEFTNERRA